MTDSETMEVHTFESVWDALEDTPAAAENMRMHSALMVAIQLVVEQWGTTQAEAALRLNVTQPRLNELLRGKISNFSLDALILLARGAGLKLRMQIERAAV